MEKIQSFKDLKVWQKAHSLTLDVYKKTKNFPSEEKFGLISQIRRAASSVPTNLVEGFKRRSTKEFCHFINISEGSLEETRYLLFLSYELGYLSEIDFQCCEDSANEIEKCLQGFIGS